MGVNPATTSVPHWSARAGEVGGARRFLLGGADVATAQRDSMFRGLEPGGRIPAAVLAEARTGDRFVLAGTAAEIGRARADLLAAGVLPVEITETLRGAPDLHAEQPRVVYCPHCHTGSPALVAIGGTHRCPGCDTELVVYHHYSHRLGAFLGYCADAEERR